MATLTVAADTNFIGQDLGTIDRITFTNVDGTAVATFDYKEFRAAVDANATFEGSSGINKIYLIDADTWLSSITSYTFENWSGVDEFDWEGTTANNTIDGTDIRDVIIGRGGDDDLNGQVGDDILYGNYGDDMLTDTAGANHFFGGTGNDQIFSAEFQGPFAADIIDGGSGEDFLSLDVSKSFAAITIDLADGGGRRDIGCGTTIAGIERIYLDGTDFSDIVLGAEGRDTLFGNKGVDHLSGRGGADRLAGGNGQDWVEGGEGSDQLFGGDEFDLTHTGNDALYGGGGRDLLMGGDGRNVMKGEGGSDVFITGGRDHIDGGAGRDVLLWAIVGDEDVVFTFTSGSANSLANGTWIINVERVAIFSGNGNDQLTGGDDGDRINGGTGDDILHGGGGRDRLEGDQSIAGADSLFGDGGDDRLIGSFGKDTLTGGGGRDAFAYARSSESTAVTDAVDIISDFTQGEDIIDLSRIDARYENFRGNGDFTFLEGDGAAFTAVAQVRFYTNAGRTYVELNTDNDLDAEGTIELAGTYALTAAVFVL